MPLPFYVEAKARVTSVTNYFYPAIFPQSHFQPLSTQRTMFIMFSKMIIPYRPQKRSLLTAEELCFLPMYIKGTIHWWSVRREEDMFSTAPQKGMCPIDSSTSVSNIYGEQLWNHIGAAQRGPLFLPPTRATNGGTEPNIDGPCPSQNQTFQPPSPYSQAPTPSPQPTATIIHVCTGR